MVLSSLPFLSTLMRECFQNFRIRPLDDKLLNLATSPFDFYRIFLLYIQEVISHFIFNHACLFYIFFASKMNWVFIRLCTHSENIKERKVTLEGNNFYIFSSGLMESNRWRRDFLDSRAWICLNPRTKL